jgi:hypothetical protein
MLEDILGIKKMNYKQLPPREVTKLVFVADGWWTCGWEPKVKYVMVG